MSDVKEELLPVKATVRMHVPGEQFNRTIDFYRVATPVPVTGGVTGKVKVSYRIVVKGQKGVVANRTTKVSADELYWDFLNGWLEAGGRDPVKGLPDGNLVGF